jgi:hypothetical protein
MESRQKSRWVAVLEDDGIITVGPLWRGGDTRDLGNPKFLLIGVFFQCMSEARALCIVMDYHMIWPYVMLGARPSRPISWSV